MACRRQAIIWTKDEISLIGPLGTNFSHCHRNLYISIQENVFENVAILSRSQWGLYIIFNCYIFSAYNQVNVWTDS